MSSSGGYLNAVPQGLEEGLQLLIRDNDHLALT